MTYRSAYRQAAMTALKAQPRFAGFEFLAAWAGPADDKTLPIIGLATPNERISPAAAGQYERVTLLQVALKRKGTSVSLESDLDADAAAIEAAVSAAIWVDGTQCFPTSVSATLNGEGAHLVGTLVVDFEITSWRAAP